MIFQILDEFPNKKFANMYCTAEIVDEKSFVEVTISSNIYEMRHITIHRKFLNPITENEMILRMNAILEII
jgi:hypothetical protein